MYMLTYAIRMQVQTRLAALLKAFRDDTLGAQFTRFTGTKLEEKNLTQQALVGYESEERDKAQKRLTYADVC